MFDKIIEKTEEISRIRTKIENEIRNNQNDMSLLDIFFIEMSQLKENCMKVKINLEEYENLKKLEHEYKSSTNTSRILQEGYEQKESEIKKLNKKIIVLEEDLRKSKSLSSIPKIEEYLNNFIDLYNRSTSLKISEFHSIFDNVIKQHDNNSIRENEVTECCEKLFQSILEELKKEFKQILIKNENISCIEDLVKTEIINVKVDIDKYHKYSINLRENSSEISSLLLETQKEFDKVNKEKFEMISSLEKQFIKLEKENKETNQINALLTTKFSNARFFLKNIFNNLLSDANQKEIENCFADNDINIEEASNLEKKIKNSLVYNISVQILENLRSKVDNKKFDLNSMIKNLKPSNNSLHTLIKYLVKLIENEDNDDNSVLNSKNATTIDRVRNLEDTLREKDETIMNFIKQNEDLLKRTPRSSRDNIEEKYLCLETENQRLKDHKNLIKRNTEEIIRKVKKNLIGSEYLVDKRIVGSFIIKILDKSTKKSIRLSMLETLASVIGYNNDERKKLGLTTVSNINNSFYNPSTTETLKEISDELYNFILNA